MARGVYNQVGMIVFYMDYMHYMFYMHYVVR